LLAERSSDSSGRSNDTEEESLKNSPEVQEAMKDVLKKHWEGWIDTELPALGGKTPRDAVQTKDGQEAVQTLLQDIENSDMNSSISVSQQPYVDWARQELGLLNA
jgi:uncharacterized protein (DUF2384 family)